MSLAYYKRFPRDFLEGTIGLSFEEKGAYSIVLDLIYARDGRLPDDGRFIAGNLNCSVRKWSTIRLALISKGKLIVQNGIISNLRADYLLENTRKYQDKQAENRATPNKINGIQSPKIDHSRDYPEPEPEEERVEKKERKNTPACADFDRFWSAYPEKVGKADARKAYDRALKRIAGPDPPSVILAGVDRSKMGRRWQEGIIPNPATWLNQGRWDDEISLFNGANGHAPDPNSPDGKRLAREANYARAFNAPILHPRSG